MEEDRMRYMMTPQRRMNRTLAAYDDWFFGGHQRLTPNRVQQPAWQSTCEDDGWRVRVELPGFSQEQVELEIEGDILSLTARIESEEKGDEEDQETRLVVKDERRLSLRIPESVHTEELVAEMEHGILSLFLPLSTPEQRGRRQIPINAHTN